MRRPLLSLSLLLAIAELPAVAGAASLDNPPQGSIFGPSVSGYT